MISAGAVMVPRDTYSDRHRPGADPERCDAEVITHTLRGPTMTNLTTAELMATVASAAVKATLVAAGGTPKTPTTPRPGHKPLSTPKTPKPPRRALTAADLAVAVHEAGHAIAGGVLGAELRNAIVGELRGGLKGQASFLDRPHGSDALIAFAGPWAQAKFMAGGRRPTQREFFAVLDTAGCFDQRVLTAAGGLHEGAAAQPILERCWPAVLTVARQLHRTGEVHHEDVCAALGITDGGGVTSVQLASIRSDCRAIPPFNAKTTATA